MSQLNDRQRLLRLGYTPLPGICYPASPPDHPKPVRYPIHLDPDGDVRGLTGWPKQEVTPEWLDDQGEAGNVTCLRMDGMLAIDLDVDVSEWVTRWLNRFLPQTRFIRSRENSARLLQLFNYEGGPVKGLTWRYQGKRQGIDLLWGNKRQFTAFGPHHSGALYQWLAGNPLEEGTDRVAEVSRADVVYAMECIEAELRQNPDVEFPSYQPGGDFGEVQKILKPDDVFEVVEPGVYVGPLTVSQLEEWTADGTELRCHLTAIRPDSDSLGGLAKRGQQGDLLIFDWVTQSTYGLAPKKRVAANRADIIARLLKEQEEDPQEDVEVELETVLADGCQPDQYVLVGGSEVVHSANTGDKFLVSHFANHIGPIAFKKWFKTAPRVQKEVFRPDLTPGVIDVEDENYGTVIRQLNTYQPPKEYEGGEVGPFFEYLHIFVPNEQEREILLDWLAWKVRDPWRRLHALSFFTHLTEGCGRNTFFNIVRSLLGPRFCKQVSWDRIAGREGQSQFTDWLDGALLVFCPEMPRPKDHQHGHEIRNKVREMVDPFGGDEEAIQKKYQGMVFARLFASYILATNHADALPVDGEDRRNIVVENKYKLPAGLAIHEWRKDLANISALRRWLRARECVYYDWRCESPPNTTSKQLVTNAYVSPLVAAIKLLVQRSTSDLVHLNHVKTWLRAVVPDAEFQDYTKDDDLLNKHLRGALKELKLSSTKGFRCAFYEGGDVKTRSFIILRNPERWGKGIMQTPEELRTEALKGIYGDGLKYGDEILRPGFLPE